MTLDEKRIAAEILIAALQAKAVDPKPSLGTAGIASEIGAAYEEIAKAVAGV